MFKYYGLIYEKCGNGHRIVNGMCEVLEKILDHLPTHYAHIISSVLKEQSSTQILYRQ
jgi:hypothetical protein